MPKRITRIKKVCKICEQTYSVYKSAADKSLFCSRDCYNQSRAPKTQTCVECNKDFTRDRKAKYCSRQCYYKNVTPPPPMLKKGKQHPVIRSKMKKLGLTWGEYNNWMEDKKRYRKEVWRITNQQPLNSLENYKMPRTLAGIEGGYQLDHIISIEEGWIMKKSPYIIGNINNLQFIPWEENLKKRYE